MTILQDNKPGTIVARILMERTAFRGSIMLIEGPDDSKFWKSRIDGDNCITIMTYCKETSLHCLNSQQIMMDKGVLAVVDSDYERVSGRFASRANLLRYDTHDLETMLIKSTAFDRVMDQVIDENKARALLAREHVSSVRDALLNRVLLYGKLRWLSLCEGWNICFDAAGGSSRFSPHRFIDIDTWQVKTAELESWFCSRVPDLSTENLRALLDSLPQVDPWEIVQGHDAIETLAAGLKKVLSNKSLSGDYLSQLLRAAYDTTDLAATNLHADLTAWEELNEPFRVVKTWQMPRRTSITDSAALLETGT